MARAVSDDSDEGRLRRQQKRSMTASFSPMWCGEEVACRARGCGIWSGPRPRLSRQFIILLLSYFVLPRGDGRPAAVVAVVHRSLFGGRGLEIRARAPPRPPDAITFRVRICAYIEYCTAAAAGTKLHRLTQVSDDTLNFFSNTFGRCRGRRRLCTAASPRARV